MRIAIVNDMRAAAEALRRVVESLPGHDLAWMAADGVEAVAMARRDRPDLILMDLLMPHLNGAEATRQIMASDALCDPGGHGHGQRQHLAGLRRHGPRRPRCGRHARPRRRPGR